jgi:hypothetical protein
MIAAIESRNSSWRLKAIATLFVLVFPVALTAQDHTLVFSVSDTGLSKAITNWGLDATWASSDNMRRGLMFMGTNEVDMVRVAFPVATALTDGDLSPAQKADLTNALSIASMAGPNTPLTLSAGTGAGVDPWFKNGAEVLPNRWVQAMEAAARFCNRPIIATEPFNEPDYAPWGQGTMQNLYDILGLLQASTNFTGTGLAGGSTLSSDNASFWYNQIKSRTTMGTTHSLGGTFDSYASFFQNVIASGDISVNPEVHNLAEVIAGAEYGLNTGIWWASAELARGSFVKACQGQRLGYAEDRAKWTAAAVYRTPDGAVQAFLGGSERLGATTTYRFFSKDRDVFYNGDGPRRDFIATIPRDQEKFIRINWGDDVQPLINGRYTIVNRNSGKVMEVAGGSTGDGAAIQQNAPTGAGNQQWYVVPSAFTYGDQSYFSIRPVHSAKSADISGWSLNPGASVTQWTHVGGENQQWFFQYAGNGYFYIRSRWSGLYVEVAGSSAANGANVQQGSLLNGFNQQWRLLPVGAAVEFVSPATPAHVVASANALSVKLHWDANVELDLAGYTVLRATNPGGPFEIVARGLTNNTFTDKSANQPRPYFYVVQATDRSLNSSSNSAQVNATPTSAPVLLARYAFDVDANDASGNANHATLVAGSPTFLAGQYGLAMNLNGTDQYAMLPAGLMASATNFTIALWLNFSGGVISSHIFDFGNDTNQYMYLTPSVRFAITTNGISGEQFLSAPPSPAGQWRHIAVTRDGNLARLYVNGVLTASNTITIAPASFNPMLNFIGDSQNDLIPLFNGRLDELFIYNYALSDSEITTLMSYPQAPGFLTQPTNVTINAGASAAFSVIAAGKAPLTYQWRMNGTNISGATSSIYSRHNAQLADAGNYYVVLTNISGAVTSAVATLGVLPAPLFQDDFDRFDSPSIVTSATTTNGYKILFNAASGGEDFKAIFGFDYSAVTYPFPIPPSPHSTGTSKGLLLSVNKADVTAAAAAVNLYPASQSFTGNFALKFDMWINWTNTATATEHTLFGINHSGNVMNRVGLAGSDGLFFAMNGDGGSSASSTTLRDYSIFRGGGGGIPILVTSAIFGPAPLLGAQFDSSNPGFTTLFPAKPIYGGTAAGSAGLDWISVEIRQEDNLITWLLNDTAVAQFSSTQFGNPAVPTSGTFLLGYNDGFGSIGDTNNFVILDNVRVDSIASLPGQLLSPHIAGNNFAFSFSADPYASYTVKYATNVAAQNWITYTNVLATGHLVEMAVPLSGRAQQYFRVSRP